MYDTSMFVYGSTLKSTDESYSHSPFVRRTAFATIMTLEASIIGVAAPMCMDLQRDSEKLACYPGLHQPWRDQDHVEISAVSTGTSVAASMAWGHAMDSTHHESRITSLVYNQDLARAGILAWPRDLSVTLKT